MATDAKTDEQNSRSPVLVSQGDLFWVTPDEARGSLPGVAHPHVVVQDDTLNRSRLTTVIVCGLTSNLKRATEPGNVVWTRAKAICPCRAS